MRRKSSSSAKPEIGAIGLVIAIFVLMFIAQFFRDAKEYDIGWFAALVWGGATFVAFLSGWLFYSQFIIPVKEGDSWANGLTLIGRYYGGQANSYLKQSSQREPRQSRSSKKRRVRKVTPEVEEKVKVLPNNLHFLPFSFGVIRAGILFSHEALAVYKDGRFQRAADPCFVMLYRKEQITHLIDLRPHLRSQAVEARTSDGISVDTSVTVIFRVRQVALDGPSLVPYPYDRDAIFDVINVTTIDAGQETRSWTEMLCPQAAAMVIDEMSRCTLNQLYEADDAGRGIDDVRDKILTRLQKNPKWDGFDILSVGIGPLKVPDEVMAQRVAGWRAKWERDIVVQEANRDADAVRRLKKARARAQIKIIESITTNIDVMRQTEDADLTEIIMLRMIEALEEAITDASVRALIPQQAITNLVMDTSNQMQTWMKRPS